MTILLSAHPLQNLRRRGIVRLHGFSEIVVNPAVFLFQRDRQRQEFLLIEAFE